MDASDFRLFTIGVTVHDYRVLAETAIQAEAQIETNPQETQTQKAQIARHGR
jgi:hypothetical protein